MSAGYYELAKITDLFIPKGGSMRLLPTEIASTLLIESFSAPSLGLIFDLSLENPKDL